MCKVFICFTLVTDDLQTAPFRIVVPIMKMPSIGVHSGGESIITYKWIHISQRIQFEWNESVSSSLTLKIKITI